jgi:glycosyltransferase involved in cell wall biosynthesis
VVLVVLDNLKVITQEEAMGAIDKYENLSIHGWACTTAFVHVEVSLTIDNVFVVKVPANVYRADLKENKIGGGDYAFEIDIPQQFQDGDQHTIAIKIHTKDSDLDGFRKEMKIPGKSKGKETMKALGSIDRFGGNKISGWVGSKNEAVFPYITANGKPCQIEVHNIERKDVAADLGIPSDVGFVATLPSTEFSNIEFKLSAISMKGIEDVSTKVISGGCLVPDSIDSIFKAVEISKKKGSVGIVVWEGTHNPIGRAQVLYNIIKDKRPSLIITFNIGFSEGAVWEPLVNSDCKVLILPWKERELYASVLEDVGLSFDLVWICKPRYPAFVLAKAISHSKTKYILDLDDNELEMSSSKASQNKPYGLLSAKMAQGFIEKMPVRSVASKTLLDDFGGTLVRHARKINPVKRARETDLSKEVRVGFIGTIRPHKGVVEAAKAIKSLNARNGYNIKFVVGGIYDPASIKSELIQLGCEVHGKIDSARLNGHLQNLDLVITGFPDDAANKEILKYQISSKIGDGLSNERPVLVPEGLSVEDLSNVAGLYLFTSLNFERILEKAITNVTPIVMDQQFSLPFNLKQFESLEKQALINSPNGQEVFSIADDVTCSSEKRKEHVVLVWKQHDSGLYGRRVDHLARSLSNQGIGVTCLELISSDQFTRYEKESSRVDSDFRFLVDDFRNKRDGFTKNGISYKTISVDYTQEADDGVRRFLLSGGFYPSDTVVVLFPAVPEWKSIVQDFSGYNIICDVVDNQLAWEKKRPLELLSQYKHLMDISKHVIFNAEDNKKFFDDAGYLKESNVSILPNWYCSPIDKKEAKSNARIIVKDKPKTSLNIAYSGNMNDRFDWDTVSRIAKEIDLPLTVHLIGNCQRSLDKMTQVLDCSAIQYHGPMRELELLRFLDKCDFAIMPHLQDEHSGFMNPMKVNMYKAIELPCVASSMPGVDFSLPGLYQAASSDDFLLEVESLSKKILAGNYSCDFGPTLESKSAKAYCDIVTNLLRN